MKNLFNLESLSIGLAMFSMFFGAGNVIFPLAIGQYAGNENIFAISGLILTAAVMPIAGIISMILFDGNYRKFFGRLGKIPGFILALLIISLLGPLGSTPRCIALSYTTLKSSFFEMNPILFSALSCGLIFLFTFRKNKILDLLGYYLTPLLLGSLLTIIIIGHFSASNLPEIDHTNVNLFVHGLKEGYNTMDLLAAFFFSSTIISILKLRQKSTKNSYIHIAFGASIIGAILLSLIYIGFSFLSAFHATEIQCGKDELLAAITLKIAGPHAGILVCVTIALACLTTAIALISAFTDFIQKEVFNEKITFEVTLIGSLLLTFVISSFEFNTISAFLGPILQIFYPGIIVLTILNIAYSLIDFKPVKIPVCCTFIVSILLYLNLF